MSCHFKLILVLLYAYFYFSYKSVIITQSNLWEYIYEKICLNDNCFFSSVACSADGQSKTQAKAIAQNAVAQSQNKAEGIWIDVRSADEYNQGHLTGAVNTTHQEIGAKITSIAPNKDQSIHLYCRSGNRANVALQELKKLGYTSVTNHGGYDDLVKQGFK